MGKVAIITEKPSARRNFETALGGKTGTFEGTEYILVNSLGHLLEFVPPPEQVPESLKGKYADWALTNLPWDETQFSWEKEIRRKGKSTDSGAKAQFAEIEKVLRSAAVTEICAACDVDFSGEGAAIAWSIVAQLGLDDGSKKMTRMKFLDESPASLQKGFRDRHDVPSLTTEGEYTKAIFRSKWDMLSMQWTRVASKVSGSQVVLRNGRLKSAMVVLVGDQFEAHNNYVKKPWFENRFRDENAVVYFDPEIDRFEDKAQVPGGLATSSVTKDGVARKKTAPPKLLDLAGLSALLSKQGIPAGKVLKIVQKGYEDQQWLSYPRTDDKVISPEQFKEMLPLVDPIARLVGVDPAVLTHRTPRKTHVKAGGAHGANRPGLTVPGSMAEIERVLGKEGCVVYEVLAKSFLRMMCEDYEYDQHSGHVTDFPTFKGTANVPVVQGWKGLLTTEMDDSDDEEFSDKGLGTTAEPFVHEGFPPRPPHPSMTWLMKQLERRSVGTGATRTSTYAEVTNNATGKALMLERKGGKLVLSEPGELNHKVVAGTNIGDLGLTEKVFEQMSQIEKAGADADAFLAQVADLVRADIATMQANAGTLPAELTDRLSAKGVFRKPVEYFDLPETLHFTAEGVTVTRAKREFSGYRFTDDEVAALCAGKSVEVTATSARTGNQFTAPGVLEGSVVEFKGKKYPTVSFTPKFPKREKVGGTYKGKQVEFNAVWGANDHWEGHRFTAAEVAQLLAGETIEFSATSKAGKSYTAKGALGQSTFKGNKIFGFQLAFDDKKSGGRAPAKKK